MAAQMFGVELIKSRSYKYRNERYLRGKVYAVDRKTRDHLVRTRFFRDAASDTPSKPIPVSVQDEPIEVGEPRGQVTVRRAEPHIEPDDEADKEGAVEV